MANNDVEKMAISVSFKMHEKELYTDLKKVKNYGQLIKDLLSQHFYNEKINQNNVDNKIMVGIDDICQIIESATKNLSVNTISAGVAPTGYVHDVNNSEKSYREETVETTMAFPEIGKIDPDLDTNDFD